MHGRVQFEVHGGSLKTTAVTERYFDRTPYHSKHYNDPYQQNRELCYLHVCILV